MHFLAFHNFWGLLSITLTIIASIPCSVSSPAISGNGPSRLNILPSDASAKSGNVPSGVGSVKLTPKQRRKYTEKCKAGKVYTVTSVEYLKDNLEEIQCIFWAAEEPTKVPVGPLFGDTLAIGNQRLLNPLSGMLWKGKFIEKVKCQENDTYLGWNKIISQPHIPFEAYLGNLQNSINAQPMYRDNKISLMIDYRKDMSAVCPDYVKMTGRNFETLPIRKSPAHHTFFPLTACLDVVRVVGRQEDGGVILLGELFGMDIFSTNQVAKPVAFFTVISYDPDLNKEFVHGQPLKPLESDKYYRNQNFMDLIMTVLPVDNLLSEPIHTVKTLASGVAFSGRGFGNFIWDVCCGSGDDTDRLTEEFKAFQPNVTSNSKKSGSKFISKHEEFHSHFKEL